MPSVNPVYSPATEPWFSVKSDSVILSICLMSPTFSTKICLISGELFQWFFYNLAIFNFKAWGEGEGEEDIPGSVMFSQNHPSRSAGPLWTESTAKSGSNKPFYECIMLLINHFNHVFYILQLKPWPVQSVINMTAAANSLCSEKMGNRRKKTTQIQTDQGPHVKKKKKSWLLHATITKYKNKMVQAESFSYQVTLLAVMELWRSRCPLTAAALQASFSL